MPAMWISLRSIICLALAGLVCLVPRFAAAQAITVTDLKKRTVTLRGPARRLLIDDGRYLLALALIHPDPISVVAAWPRDVNRLGNATYDKFVEKFPRVTSLAQVASSAATFSLEQAIAVNPDVAVFTLGQGPSDEQVGQLERAGISVVFIDFFTHPLSNLEPSLRLLGQITGRDQAARAFLDFRRSRLTRIAERLKRNGAGVAPRVFFEAHAGISPECCNSPGKGNIGDYIDFVGGRNIGAEVLPGASGRLNIEFVVSRDPTVYILTGGPHLEKPGGFVVGPAFTVDRSRESLRRMTARTGIANLPVVKTGRVHGLSHQLLNSPLDIVTVEILARWIQPSLFGDLDPAATLAEINRNFLAVPVEGPLWVDLRTDGKASREHN
jgi:iron complex transport system substrate-binding protein